MVLQFKAPVCGHSINGIADSNPADGMIARSVMFVVCCCR